MGERRATKRRENEKINNRLSIVAIIIVVACLGMVLNLKSTGLRKADLDYHQKELLLEAQLQAENERTEYLQKWKDHVTTKEYIEEVAKEKLGLVRPNEILLKPSR